MSMTTSVYSVQPPGYLASIFALTGSGVDIQGEQGVYTPCEENTYFYTKKLENNGKHTLWSI